MASSYEAEREALWLRQRQALERLLRLVRQRNRFWAEKLRSWSDRPIRTYADLRTLPVTDKEELVRDQEAHPPYGTNLTFPLTHYVRLHQTSGTTRATPLRWLDTQASWSRFVDLWVQIYRWVGVHRGDRVMFPFSFGPFIGFWGAFEAAQQMGLFCLSGGGMTSKVRIKALLLHGITVLPCTPTYALHLAEVASAEGIDLRDSAVRLLIVAGEPGGSIPEVRQRIQTAWDAEVKDHWGMTEVGALGVECPAVPRRMHLLEEACIAEVVDPATGEPVTAGGEGELVITTLWRDGSPVIRYRTGDMVRLTPPQKCPCGTSFIGLDGGILGRRDQMIFIRGNNVYPSALESVVRTFPEVMEFRITVDRSRAMPEVLVEIEPQASLAGQTEALTRRVAEAIRERLHFRAQVQAVPPGSLPRYELKARRLQIR